MWGTQWTCGYGGCGGHGGLVDAVELVDCGHDCGPVDIERKDGGCVVVI